MKKYLHLASVALVGFSFSGVSARADITDAAGTVVVFKTEEAPPRVNRTAGVKDYIISKPDGTHVARAISDVYMGKTRWMFLRETAGQPSVQIGFIGYDGEIKVKATNTVVGYAVLRGGNSGWNFNRAPAGSTPIGNVTPGTVGKVADGSQRVAPLPVVAQYSKIAGLVAGTVHYFKSDFGF